MKKIDFITRLKSLTSYLAKNKFYFSFIILFAICGMCVFFNITIGIILFLVIFIINIFLCKKYYSWTATIIEILYEINFSLLLIINFFPIKSCLSSYNIIYLAGILFYTILQSYFLAGRKKEILNSNQLFLELFRRTWIDYKKTNILKRIKIIYLS